MNLDWICKNWEFIKNHRVQEIREFHAQDLMMKSAAPTSGKFFGTLDFYQSKPYVYKNQDFQGNLRLFLRPFVCAPMPEERISAIYIDPKKYVFDEEERIVSLKSHYEVPVFLFIKEQN